MAADIGTTVPLGENSEKVVLKSYSYGFALTDSGGILRWTNTRFLELAGTDEPPLAGLALQGLRCWAEDARTTLGLAQAIVSGSEWEGVVELHDGIAPSSARLQLMPVGEPGEPARFLVVLDQTQWAVSGGAQAVSLPQPEKMESIVRLASSVAHDLNNLLTVINGYSAMLLAGMSHAQKPRDTVEKIHAAGKRAAELVRQLLNEY